MTLKKLAPTADDMIQENMKFYTGYNPPPRFYEENDGISLTNPDSGMSLREMVKRYVNGEVIEGHEVYYDDQEENMQPQNFDLSDITESEKTIKDFFDKKDETPKPEDEPVAEERSEAKETKPKGKSEKGEVSSKEAEAKLKDGETV